MRLIDTHTHIYLEDFKSDIDIVIESALEQGVDKMLLPHIDSSTTKDLENICNKYPDHCFPMMGLHPTSVNNNFKRELIYIENQLSKNNYIAIGEIGLDLYWDKTFKNEQIEAFLFQIDLAKKYKLPIAVHTRNSFSETISLLEKEQSSDLTGVFHCFSGTLNDAYQAAEMGYKLGIGGVVTFKKSSLVEIVQNIDLKHLLPETDAPFLAPHPYRGKRNEPAYLTLIAQKIAEIKAVSLEEVAEITTATAQSLFFSAENIDYSIYK